MKLILISPRHSLAAIMVLFVLALFSCEEEKPPAKPEEEQPPVRPEEEQPGEDPEEKDEVKLKGVILEDKSGAPIENVQIIGFVKGSVTNNLSTFYGSPVVLGTTDKCGKFNVTLPDSIKGAASHGNIDTTVVKIYFSRLDFGSKMNTIPFKSDSSTYTLTFAPKSLPFYNYFKVLLSEDEKTVKLNWEIYSAQKNELCHLPVSFTCPEFAGQYIRIWRSDEEGIRHELPFKVGVQSIEDSDLPDGDFKYTIDFSGTSNMIEATIERGHYDTIYAVRPPVYPVLNSCK